MNRKEEKRILFFQPSTSRGGAEEYAINFCLQAKRRGYKVFFAIPNNPNTTSIRNELRDAGVRVLSFRSKTDYYMCSRTNLLKRIHAFLNILESIFYALYYRVDKVLINLPSPYVGFSIIEGVSFLRKRCLVIFQLLGDHHSFKSDYIKKCFHQSMKNNKELQWICVSNNNMNLANQIFEIPKEDIKLIHHGVKPFDVMDKFDKIGLRNLILKRLNIEEPSIVFCSTGRLSKQKGYEFVLEAFPQLLKENKNAYYLILGSGEQRKELQNLIDERELSKHVLLLGYKKNVIEYLNAADIYLFPSVFEGLAFSLIEAMSAGLPIIASDKGPIPELIEHKKTGLLMDINDSQDVLEKLKWGIENMDKMSGFGINARRKSLSFTDKISFDLIFETLN